MESKSIADIDAKVRQSFSIWKRVDRIDVDILEGLSLLGPRNLALIAEHLSMPTTTVRYRVRCMLEDSVLFLHLNPYHTYLGLKKALIFVEAVPGFEDALLECLKVNDYWLFLCRIYGPYEGCGGVWTIPMGREKEFKEFLQHLMDIEVAKSIEINWTTCHEGIPVSDRWFNANEKIWSFNWEEWIKEVQTIEGDMPWTLIEPSSWPIKVDYEDLLIIKELEIDGKATLTSISKKLNIPLEKLKYHFREHVSKGNIIEGYQVEIYRFPSLASEYLFFKFDFDSYDKLRRFALSLKDKPFPFHIGKVIGELALTTHIYLPKWEFRKFIATLSTLIKIGALKGYRYVIQDMFQCWRETIPYQHFKDGKWEYDIEGQKEKIKKIIESAI